MTSFATRRDATRHLAPRIALALLVKALGLTVLWFLFVRDQRVLVDAHGIAAAFGLVDGASSQGFKPNGDTDGK